MINEQEVVARLIADEGEVLHAYDDHLGFATIGVGRLIDKRKGGGISHDEAMYLLENDIRRCAHGCQERYAWFEHLDPVRQQVIICMAFQLGFEGVAKFKLMIRAIEIGDWISASLEMQDSDWRQQTQARCDRMALIMRSGRWQ